jgi:hypothetical protein
MNPKIKPFTTKMGVKTIGTPLSADLTLDFFDTKNG